MLPLRARVGAALILTALTVSVWHQPNAHTAPVEVGAARAEMVRVLPVRADRGESRTVPPTVPVVAVATVTPAVRNAAHAAPTVRPIGGPSAGAWARLRQCESGGSYADRRNGKYRGAYQFDRSTWASVGGHGDPADAAPAEQDARAQALYARYGAGRWPVCGRYLR